MSSELYLTTELYLKFSIFFVSSDNNIEWFEVAILAWYFYTRSAATTEKHWHLYRKSARHEGGMKEA